jgi:hypothetical protein
VRRHNASDRAQHGDVKIHTGYAARTCSNCEIGNS